MPPIKIPVHVLSYTLALVPAFGYTWYTMKSKLPEEDLEKEIRHNFKAHVQTSENNRQAMAQFFKGIRDSNQLDSKQSEELDSVMRAGKDTVKRHYAVDKRLYGTEEGLKLAEELQQKKKEDDLKKKKERSKNKKRKKDIQNGSIQEDPNKKDVVKSNEEDNQKEIKTTLDNSRKEIGFSREKVTMAAMMASAVAVGYLLGDRRTR